MKKLPLILVLAFVSSNAMAEWTFIGTTRDNVIAHYIDKNIIRNGDIVKVWRLIDEPQRGPAVGSAILWYEINCRNKESKLLALVEHEGNMGKGKVVFHREPTNQPWTSIPPKSIAHKTMTISCSREAKLLMSSSAMAEWIETSSDPKSGGVYYVNPTSAKDLGNGIVRMHTAMDLDKTSVLFGNPGKSARSVVDFDCKDWRVKFISHVEYSKNGLKGEIVGGSDIEVDLWMPIPNTESAISLRKAWITACTKYK
jgi:hypothetical protein